MSQNDNNKNMSNIFVPSPRPGGLLKIKIDTKEKKYKKKNQYQTISNRVEDMEKDKYRIEKNIAKNPPLPTITPIINLNLPKISQESLFEKYLVENEDNGKTNCDHERWLEETTPAKNVNLINNLEDAINFIVTLASNPSTDNKDFDETQAISVVLFLRTIKSPAGQYEPNNRRLMEYIDKKGEEYIINLTK